MSSMQFVLPLIIQYIVNQRYRAGIVGTYDENNQHCQDIGGVFATFETASDVLTILDVCAEANSPDTTFTCHLGLSSPILLCRQNIIQTIIIYCRLR